MLNEIRARAYAKVNFGLNVLPKRPDGFHNLESVFQTIDLYDELIVVRRREKGCFVSCSSMSLPEENTLTKAYEAFCGVTGRRDFGINVELVKGIPSGGGLGGGSSDAASLIRVLQSFYGIQLSASQLSQIAGEVGSDVFFFTHCNGNGTGCALVSGRGEVVKNIAGRNDLFLLLCFPKVSSSTKLAYTMIDEMFAQGINLKSPPLAELEKIYNLPPEKWSFVNTFTPVISREYPEIAEAIKLVKNTGALFTEMSGSGSTVYGIFTSVQQAVRSRNLLAKDLDCEVVKTVCCEAILGG